MHKTLIIVYTDMLACWHDRDWAPSMCNGVFKIILTSNVCSQKPPLESDHLTAFWDLSGFGFTAGIVSQKANHTLSLGFVFQTADIFDWGCFVFLLFKSIVKVMKHIYSIKCLIIFYTYVSYLNSACTDSLATTGSHHWLQAYSKASNYSTKCKCSISHTSTYVFMQKPLLFLLASFFFCAEKYLHCSPRL